MPTPEELEAAADRLRDCATSGRTKAQALATHLDTVATTAKDPAVWKGPYPEHGATIVDGAKGDLGRTATQLRDDAAAWDKKATELDEQAEQLRKEIAKKAAQEAAEDKKDDHTPSTPSGPR